MDYFAKILFPEEKTRFSGFGLFYPINGTFPSSNKGPEVVSRYHQHKHEGFNSIEQADFVPEFRTIKLQVRPNLQDYHQQPQCTNAPHYHNHRNNNGYQGSVFPEHFPHYLFFLFFTHTNSSYYF
jgi:hypothetical protein